MALLLYVTHYIGLERQIYVEYKNQKWGLEDCGVWMTVAGGGQKMVGIAESLKPPVSHLSGDYRWG